MVLPNGNVSFGITTNQIRQGLHMDQATDGVLIVSLQDCFFRQFIDFKRFSRLVAPKIHLMRILDCGNLISVYFALTVTYVYVTQRSAKCSWEFDFFFAELRERIVFISAQIVSDGFARQNHK